MHHASPYRPDEPVTPVQRKSRLGTWKRSRRPRLHEAQPVAPATVADAPGDGLADVQSLQTAANCTTIVEADMAESRPRAESGLSYLPFRAGEIETLLEFPPLNATLEDNTTRSTTERAPGIAVSLGDGGLIVPVIRDAQDLSVEGLAKRIKDLARRARAQLLSPDEVRGGTFTITNPGGYGSMMATPVINLPQVAILDTEAVVKRPVVVTDELGNDAIAIRR